MCKYLVALFLLVINHYADADTNVSDNPATKNYIFIENNVDNAFFIATTKLDPRFSGPNIFSSYTAKQESLGYMGNNKSYAKNQYVDVWLENSPITQPFVGIRCKKSNTKSCPLNGLLNDSSTILNDGVYHVKAPNYGWDDNSLYFRGSFNESFYAYIKSLPINSSPTLKLSYCSIDPEYDYNPSKGETCTKTSGKNKRIGSQDFTIIKEAHLQLSKTNYLEEIFVDTNGNPSIVNNSNLCVKATISNINGLVCKLINYSLSGNFNSFNKLLVYMNTSQDFKPDYNNHLKYSNSIDPTGTWYNYDQKVLANKVFSPNLHDIYVFFSQNYLKKIITSQSNSSAVNKQFSFALDNSGISPESGYYEFTPSSQFIIKSKEHSISIANDHHSSDNSLTGTLGSTSPITFNYIVSVSSGELADKITASVSGPTIDVNGKTYCKFTSEDEKIVVPFPAYLSFKKENLLLEKKTANCDNEVIDITKASWDKTDWNDDIMVLQTNLTLSFPMNDPISLKTVDSQDWEGSVSAAGTITVNAEWPNVK